MQGRLKRDKIKRRESLQGWGVIIASFLLTVGFDIAAKDVGLSRKWVTAAIGTVGSFAFVIYVRRRNGPRRWSFWAAISICLAAHSAVVGMFFQYVLADVRTFSIWFWSPIMVAEMFVLLIAVKRVEEKITGRRETIKLSF
jgi:hypothetical protein